MPGRVVVIGAGNTAIDAAIAAVRLGASEVTMAYRRGAEQMSAFAFEYEHAKAEGVRFLWHVQPVAIEGGDKVEAVRMVRLEHAEDGSLIVRAGSEFTAGVDTVVLAIGQATHTGFLADAGLKLERGRVVIERATGQTSNAKYFAGGDCTNGGREVVDAVADGKRAGLGMVAWLRAGKEARMPTLKNTFAGIECLNPFWLASAPPTNCGEQIMRAFDAGWGGAVWKTIGEPITNVSSRYSSIDFDGRKMMGFNNIELISDRPIETNLREIAEVKRRYPKHVVIASLMVERSAKRGMTWWRARRMRARMGWS